MLKKERKSIEAWKRKGKHEEEQKKNESKGKKKVQRMKRGLKKEGK